MNIFFLSICVRRCAAYHFDKHVVKMILEMCQLASTAWHMLNADEAKVLLENGKIMRLTHKNHPCAVWTRKHVNNYKYVVELGLALCDEWRKRYGHAASRRHGCEDKLQFLLDNPPTDIPSYKIQVSDANPRGFTFPMPQAMPDECRYEQKSQSVYNCQVAYRRYYMSDHKAHLRKWSIRDHPEIDIRPSWTLKVLNY